MTLKSLTSIESSEFLRFSHVPSAKVVGSVLSLTQSLLMVEMMQLIIAPRSGLICGIEKPPCKTTQRGGGQLEVRRVSIRSFQHEGVAASGPCPLEEQCGFVDTLGILFCGQVRLYLYFCTHSSRRKATWIIQWMSHD